MLFLLLCVSGLATVSVIALPTPKSTTDVRSNINKEYKLQYYVSANWFNANLFCRDNGMQLAAIQSQEEQDYLTDLIEELGRCTAQVNSDNFTDNEIDTYLTSLAIPYWISGTDLGYEERYSWFSNGKLFKYTNWGNNQPEVNKTDEHCVLMRENYTWHDYPCTRVESFICEIDLSNN